MVFHSRPTPTRVDPVVARITFNFDMEQGAQNGDVRVLQKFLNDNGYTITSTGIGAPGYESDYFGTLTRDALKRFQIAQGIPGTGNLGPLTRKRITEFSEEKTQLPSDTSRKFTSSLFLGSTSSEVSLLQTFLSKDKEIYPEGIITGYFGPLTKEAVVRFQLKYKIILSSSDLSAGYIGPKTREKLNELFP